MKVRCSASAWAQQPWTFEVENNNPPPAVLSMNPLNGNIVSGAPTTVTATVSDASGVTDIQYVELKVSDSGGSNANACYLRYTRSSGLFQLADNAGTLQSTLTNSQCSVSAPSASTAANGDLTATQLITRKHGSGFGRILAGHVGEGAETFHPFGIGVVGSDPVLDGTVGVK